LLSQNSLEVGGALAVLAAKDTGKKALFKLEMWLFRLQGSPFRVILKAVLGQKSKEYALVTYPKYLGILSG
jgi:hypothetical protein